MVVDPSAARRAISLALSIFLALAAGLAGFAPAAAQNPSWSTPLNLSPRGQSSWWPDVAVDGTGRIHTVWSSGFFASSGDNFDIVDYNSSDGGLYWNRLNDIVALPRTTESGATRPSLLPDRRGILHMTYLDSTVLYYTRAAAVQAYSGRAWSPPVRLSSDQAAYYSRLASDDQGTLHLIYTENVPTQSCMNCYHLFYRQSADDGATWTQPKDISADLTGSAKPQIYVDNQGSIHVVWESGDGGGLGQLLDPTTVKYTTSHDRGETWTSPVSFTTDGSESDRNIAIGGFGPDHLAVVWLSTPQDKVVYRISTDHGATWSAPTQLPGVWGAWSVYPSHLDDYSLATDSAGKLHLVFVGRLAEGQTSLNLLHVVWNGSSWSQPESIIEMNGDVPEWPRITVGLGNQLHVIWFVRDEKHVWESDKGLYRIWYSRETAAAPALPTAVYPTSEPSPSAGPTSLPTSASPGIIPPTPVPLAPQPANLMGLKTSLATESNLVILFGIVLLPSAAMILVVVVIRAIRKHFQSIG